MGKKNPRCLRRGSSISMNIYSGSNPVVFLSPEQEEAVEKCNKSHTHLGFESVFCNHRQDSDNDKHNKKVVGKSPEF